MSGISAEVGLISGINIGQLVSQLVAIERRPIDLLQQRIATITNQQTAFLDLSARLLSLSNAASAFGATELFDSVTASSSNESILSAAASTGAAPGSYQFRVLRLAQASSLISMGFTSADSVIGAGNITLSLGPNRVSEPTRLDFLNDFQGVSPGVIEITDRSGNSAELDLSAALTLDDVLDAINSEGGINVTAFVQGDRIVLEDTTGAGSIIVQDVSGTAAADLGILGDSGGAAQLVGDDIFSLARATPVSLLRNGLGVGTRSGLDDIRITRRDGTVIDVNLSSAESIQDVLDLINNDDQNADGLLTVSIGADGNRLVVTDASAGGALTIASLNGSTAAEDLGIAGTDAGGVINGANILGGLNTVLLGILNGGSGVAAGSISIQDRSGATQTIDLSGAETLAEAVALINAAAVNVTASLNQNGTALVITDNTGSTAFNLVIDEAGSTTAADLGILTGPAGVDASTVRGDALSRRLVSENTLLADLNGGQGVSAGSFRITNTLGASAVVDLSQTDDERLSDVIEEINSRGIGVTASINATGDGLVLTDTNGGSLQLEVEEVGAGTTAADLGILGTADVATPDTITGYFRVTIAVDADDSLQDVADALNKADIGVTASVVNTGSPVNPFRLVLTSESTGLGGNITIFSDIEGFDFDTLQEPGDALLQLGSGDTALQILSRNNTFDQVVPGLTLTANAVSATPVTVTVSEDTAAVLQSVSNFVDAFNSVLDAISDATTFNGETQESGILLGDSTVRRIESRLRNAVNVRVAGLGSLNSLVDIGIRFNENGRLGFDEEQFNSIFQANPGAVEALLADEDVGVAAQFEDLLDALTDENDGLIARHNQALDDRIESYNDNIERLERRVSAYETRLRKQFLAMEMALAQLQNQQTAIANFPRFVFNRSSRSNSLSFGT